MSSNTGLMKRVIKSPRKSGSSIETSCSEDRELPSEEPARAGSYFRVLDSYVFLQDGRPVELDVDRFHSQNWEGISVLGAGASLVGKGSMFAQCGWFTRMPWLWFQIRGIHEVSVKSDARFRGGERCMWLTTAVAEYAVLLPHACFAQLWDRTLEKLGGRAKWSPFQRLPLDADCPMWWDEAVDRWPNPNPSLSHPELKRGHEMDVDGVKKQRVVDDASHPMEVSSAQDGPSVTELESPKLTKTKRAPWNISTDQVLKTAGTKRRSGKVGRA